MRELGGDANCVTDGQTHRHSLLSFIVKDIKKIFKTELYHQSIILGQGEGSG